MINRRAFCLFAHTYQLSLPLKSPFQFVDDGSALRVDTKCL